MIYDCKNQMGVALENGVEVDYNGRQVLSTPDGVFENCTFRNFKHLETYQISFVNCTFEDCLTVSIEEGSIIGCTFRRMDTLFVTGVDIIKSHFSELECHRDCVICLEDGNISYCTFNKVALHDDSWLCDAVGDCYVKHCKFTNCTTSRSDRKLFHCEETIGHIIRRKKVFCIVDGDTCEGLDDVIEIGNFDLE